MIEEINDLDSLNREVQKHYDSSKYIFRGQNKLFRKNNDSISFDTSIDRKGCNAPEMFKWSFYAERFMAHYMRPEFFEIISREKKLIYEEAILQHYGWRSFFVDLTKAADVALWFSAYTYSDRTQFHVTEDCNEVGLIEMHSIAEYSKSREEHGYVFVFDRNKLMASNQDFLLADLDEAFVDNKLRPKRQKGLLFGPSGVHNDMFTQVLNDSLLRIMRIKKEVLEKYNAQSNLNAGFLFPASQEDDLYQTLLDLPRRIISKDDRGIEIFASLLKLPEYQNNFQKRQPSHIAYYKSFCVAEKVNEFSPSDGSLEHKSQQLNKAVFLKCSEDAYFFKSDKGRDACLIDFLKECPDFVLEFDNIFRVFSECHAYFKGIRCQLLHDNVVYISEIIIDWLGTTPTGIYENLGWHYQIEKDSLVRKESVDDCLCNNESRHQSNLYILRNFVEVWMTQRFKVEDKVSIWLGGVLMEKIDR